MPSFQRIVVALDFSSHSSDALDRAIEVASSSGAVLELVHAFEFPVPLLGPYEIAVPDNYVTQMREEAVKLLEGSVERVRSAGIEVRSHLLDGPPVGAITQLAEETAADLIVLGSHGHTGLKHALLGSVAERTVRHAHCSVLTVKST